ncbi:MAG: hypothetical protein Q9227_002440 [Pyrenula ochraceoflavens]
MLLVCYFTSWLFLSLYFTLYRRASNVYSPDASLIVSLLDIHVLAAAEDLQNQPLEILEAGTGHGSLTLHLARAIHAANRAPPSLPPPSQSLTASAASPNTSNEDRQWIEWRKSRKAIIHSVEAVPSFSHHAEKLVRQFRRGIYAGHIDFHVSTVQEWIATKISERRKVTTSTADFLSYVVLDMPSSHLQIEHVAPAMREGALLAIFTPSITQIGDCLRVIKDQKLPLVMEKTVELGVGMSSGRLWDVRFAQKRKTSAYLNSETAKLQEADEDDPSTGTDQDSESSDTSQREETRTSVTGTAADEPVLVCRPKVGERIVGGGFVGLWKKLTPLV